MLISQALSWMWKDGPDSGQLIMHEDLMINEMAYLRAGSDMEQSYTQVHELHLVK
ncbi:MAG TPA: hypothetical protein VFI24_11945 [Pyrinomonadaceae bacterium]|nr:hypothetical protein [Pyrinomonadaceae bacterium]